MLLLLAAAMAAPPDKVATTFTLGSSAVDRVAASADGRLVGAVTGGALHVVDTETWEVLERTPCDVQDVSFERLTETLHWLYLACGDGTVRPFEWNDGALAAAVDSEGAVLSYDLGEDPVVGVFWAGPASLLYALTKASNAVTLHAVDPDAGTIDDGAFPLALLQPGYVEGGISLTTLWIAHGGDDVTQLSLGSESPVVNPTPDPYSVKDATPSSRASFFAVDGQGLALEYLFSGNSFALLLTGLGTTDALGVSRSTDDEWMTIASGTTGRSYPMADGALTDQDPVATFTLPGTVTDVVVARYGYAFGAGASGALSVLTANPWVGDVTATPSGPLADGETTTVTFTIDEPGDWEIRLGGDSSGGGAILETGTASAAGTVTVPLVADASWLEGTNPLYVFVDDAAGNTGHGRTEVTVDNPPGAPTLTSDSLRFGDGFLRLSFAGIADADLARYDVFVTVTPFDPADHPTGGPAFDGTDALETPIQVEATGGESVDEIIFPLTNGVRYYVAVRAYDTGGKEGPMSDVVDGVPKPTFSASEQANDPGGAPCDTGRTGGGLLAGLALAALAVGRRRALPLVGLLAAIAPLQAHAEPRTDDTPTRGNFEVRYGGMSPKDPDIQATYAEHKHDVLMMEFGPQLWRVAELDMGIGFYQDLGHKLDDAGAVSGQRSMLTLWPLSLSATGRLHLLDEQVLVPFGTVGFDYVIWGEEWETASTEREKKRGAKAGYHYGAGVSLLLDTFARRRASYLEAQTGINDTSIVFEWRRQVVEPGKFLFFDNSRGLSFSGDLITVGLKLDY